MNLGKRREAAGSVEEALQGVGWRNTIHPFSHARYVMEGVLSDLMRRDGVPLAHSDIPEILSLTSLGDNRYNVEYVMPSPGMDGESSIKTIELELFVNAGGLLSARVLPSVG